MSVLRDAILNGRAGSPEVAAWFGKALAPRLAEDPVFLDLVVEHMLVVIKEALPDEEPELYAIMEESKGQLRDGVRDELRKIAQRVLEAPLP